MFIFLTVMIVNIDFQKDSLELSNDYYKQATLSFCEMAASQTQVIKLTTNSTKLKDLNQFLYEGLTPCDRWLLERDK